MRYIKIKTVRYFKYKYFNLGLLKCRIYSISCLFSNTNTLQPKTVILCLKINVVMKLIITITVLHHDLHYKIAISGTKYEVKLYYSKDSSFVL